MRRERERYFADETVQQEYRDILDRQTARHEAAVAAARNERRAAAENPYLRSDASPSSYVFDGGEAEARAIFRRNGEFPCNTPETLPASGGRKGDRLPVSKPEPRQPSLAFDPPRAGVRSDGADGITGVALRREDDPLRAFETQPPLRFDGENHVEQLQGGQPERPLPIKWTLENQINYAAQRHGVGVEVHSGGQPPKEQRKPQYQKRGTRHDYGNAADVDLYVVENGKRRYLDSRNPDDRKMMQNFMRDAVVAGATGIGHGYMWHRGNQSMTTRIHVGGGDARAWSDQTDDPKLNRPFPWVEAARQQGEAARFKLVPPEAWQHPVAPVKPGVDAGPDGPVDLHGRYWMRPRTGWSNASQGDRNDSSLISNGNALSGENSWSNQDERLSLIRRMLDNYLKPRDVKR